MRRSGPATLGEHVRVVRGAVGTKHARCTRAPRCGHGSAFGVAVPSLGQGRSARIRRRECLAARSRPRHIRRGRLRDGEPILRDAVAWAGPWMLHIPAKRGGRPRAGDGGRAARRYRRECLAARSWPRHIPGGRLHDGEPIPRDAVACAGVDGVPPYRCIWRSSVLSLGQGRSARRYRRFFLAARSRPRHIPGRRPRDGERKPTYAVHVWGSMDATYQVCLQTWRAAARRGWRPRRATRRGRGVR